MEKAWAVRLRRLVALAVSTIVVVAPSHAGAQTPSAPRPYVVSVDPAAYPDVALDVVVPGVANGTTLGAGDLVAADARVTGVSKLPAGTLDVVLVVDDRRSIGAVAFAQVKEVAATLVASLDPGTHVAVNTVTGLGGFPTDDLTAADQFVRRLTSAVATAAQTPGKSLVRLGGLLQPGAGRRTHVVLVTSEPVPVDAADDTALRALLGKARSELSVLTLAKQLDPSIAALVTPGGVGTADTGQGVGALTVPVDAVLTSQYRVQLAATRTGRHTLAIRLAGVDPAPLAFIVDQPGSGPTTSASSGSGSASTSTVGAATTATTAATTTATTAATTTVATTAATNVATTAATGAATSTTAAAPPAVTTATTTNDTGRSSRARPIALVAAVGVLLGGAAAVAGVRRFRRRAHASPWVEFDTLRVSSTRDDAWRAGRELRLDPNERDVLLALVRRPGHIYSSDDVAAIAWPDRGKVSPRLVSTLMDHLQRTVDGLDDAPLVHAVRGAGYVLSDPADTDSDIASAIRPRPPRYAPPPDRRASRK